MTRSSALALVCLLAACAKEPLLSPDLPGPTESEPVPTASPEAAAVPEGAIVRAELEAVLREGPAWLLSRIQMEELLADGKFQGWRLRELPIEWSRVDLRAGDVVTRINTMPIESPTDFWSAWTTLSVASEVKVDFLRDGAAKEVRIPIVGQADPAAAARLEKAAPPAPSPRDKRFETVTIAGDGSAYGD